MCRRIKKNKKTMCKCDASIHGKMNRHMSRPKKTDRYSIQWFYRFQKYDFGTRPCVGMDFGVPFSLLVKECNRPQECWNDMIQNPRSGFQNESQWSLLDVGGIDLRWDRQTSMFQDRCEFTWVDTVDADWIGAGSGKPAEHWFAYAAE